jgi:hypothetical protein
VEMASMDMCGIHPGCERYAVVRYSVAVRSVCSWPRPLRMSTELSVLDTIEVRVTSA